MGDYQQCSALSLHNRGVAHWYIFTHIAADLPLRVQLHPEQAQDTSEHHHQPPPRVLPVCVNTFHYHVTISLSLSLSGSSGAHEPSVVLHVNAEVMGGGGGGGIQCNTQRSMYILLTISFGS